MRLFDVLRTGAVIDPSHLARFRIERVHERPHEGPDAGGEVDRIITNDRTTTSRPSRRQSSIADRMLRTRRGVELPQQIAIRRIDAIQETIIATKKDATLPTDRRKSHRCFREDRPPFIARRGVQRDHLITVIETDEQTAIHHDRLEDAIVRHQVQVQRVVPSLPSRREFFSPQQPQFVGQHVVRCRSPPSVIPPHRPIITSRRRRERHNRCDQDK